MIPMLARPPAAALLLAAAALGGCGVQASRDAERARSQLYGMTRLDLHRCAGLPTRSETLDGHLLDTYEVSTPPPSFALSLPAIGPVLGGGGFNVGGGSTSCRATFELVEGKVVSLHYAGATASGLGGLAACGPLVEHCLTDMPAPGTTAHPPGG
ncbi:MAG: hypothetical protein U1E53_00050 [Dongiaceae bacterium]